MPYWMRVFARDSRRVSADELRSELDHQRFELVIEEEESDNWQQIIIRHKDGEEIALVDCNEVADNSLGAGEISEFLEDTKTLKPESSAEWLRRELPKVKAIYAFQILHGTDVNDGWNGLHPIFSFVREARNGFSQADLEGFSNDDGYQITWEFSERVSGSWNMALLKNGEWVRFEMDLGDREQRREFQEGTVPAHARRL